MKAHIITWALSVVASCVVGAAWVYTHPTQQTRFAKVDVAGLLEQEIRGISANLKMELSEEDKKKLKERIELSGKRLDEAFATLSNECRCVLLTSAAIAKDSGESIPDLTWRAKELLRQ